MKTYQHTEVLQAIQSERIYQERKWPNHKHTVAEWILIMEKCLNDAKQAWYRNPDDYKVLHEIRQVVAVGVAAMEQCGAPPRRENHGIGPVVGTADGACER